MATLSLCLLAAAPSPATAPITDWSDIEVVVVTPDHPGPPFWHVARGNSEVWILPTVAPTPKGLAWDSHETRSLLKGANALLLPPRAQLGVFEGLWFYMTAMDSLEQPDGTTLEATLPAPLKSRFIAARTHAGQGEDRYAKYLGAVAAVMLESDYMKSVQLTPNGLQKAIESLAAQQGVPARAVASYPAMDVIHDVPNMSAEAHRNCIAQALSDIDLAAAHAVPAAQAWAAGDVAGIKANFFEIRIDNCLQQNAAYSALRENANRDMASAVIAALNRPGKTVAVIPLGFFLRKGGVLERLEAAGLTVTGPAL